MGGGATLVGGGGSMLTGSGRHMALLVLSSGGTWHHTGTGYGFMMILVSAAQ
jgi:hypothetical protein